MDGGEVLSQNKIFSVDIIVDIIDCDADKNPFLKALAVMTAAMEL